LEFSILVEIKAVVVGEILPELYWIDVGVVDLVMHVFDLANFSNVHRLAADQVGVGL